VGDTSTIAIGVEIEDSLESTRIPQLLLGSGTDATAHLLLPHSQLCLLSPRMVSCISWKPRYPSA